VYPLSHQRRSRSAVCEPPPARYECGRRKSRLLPALARLQKRLRALLRGASIPISNPTSCETPWGTRSESENPPAPRSHPCMPPKWSGSQVLPHPKTRPQPQIPLIASRFPWTASSSSAPAFSVPAS
jgi:hypothetical protein